MTVRTPGLAWPQHKGTLGARYEEARQRIVEVIREATSSDDAAAARPVPACPGWRVRDVLAHLCGNCTDIAAGNIAVGGIWRSGSKLVVKRSSSPGRPR